MKIFAYGTLKKGGILHQYMEGAKYIQKKKLHGYVLYLAPNEIYPLIYYTGNNKDVVQGEVWKINKKIRKVLDKHEQGYIVKKLLKTPILFYYPDLSITHSCQKIPKNSRGIYEFNVTPNYYKGVYKKKSLNNIVIQKHPLKKHSALGIAA